MNGEDGTTTTESRDTSPAQELIGSIEGCQRQAGIIANRLGHLEARLFGEHPTPATAGEAPDDAPEQGFYFGAASKILDLFGQQNQALEILTRIEEGTFYEG